MSDENRYDGDMTRDPAVRITAVAVLSAAAIATGAVVATGLDDDNVAPAFESAAVTQPLRSAPETPVLKAKSVSSAPDIGL